VRPETAFESPQSEKRDMSNDTFFRSATTCSGAVVTQNRVESPLTFNQRVIVSLIVLLEWMMSCGWQLVLIRQVQKYNQ
jgi:hypothetical protein